MVSSQSTTFILGMSGAKYQCTGNLVSYKKPDRLAEYSSNVALGGMNLLEQVDTPLHTPANVPFGCG